ncbi:hypothetical protein TEA_008190 [Camellia sinensis var. sinensis]|uniref:Homeobox domain-containing protein n=1 Tax=Camellia sinensis var. sinensis TaxID=542762 RepID=A0A4S4ELJ6_CAMSN|nr:hypothetical protein TEA_008190 [Camellia sinensis var. sinensis]
MCGGDEYKSSSVDLLLQNGEPLALPERGVQVEGSPMLRSMAQLRNRLVGQVFPILGVNIGCNSDTTWWYHYPMSNLTLRVLFRLIGLYIPFPSCSKHVDGLFLSVALVFIKCIQIYFDPHKFASCGDSLDRNGSSEEEADGNNNFIDPQAEDRELKGQLLRRYSGYLGSLKQEFMKKRKKGKLPKEARQQLLDWWSRHYKWPYPSESQKLALAESTGLDQKQINNWFINQRKRHWKPSEDMQFVVMDATHPHYYMDNVLDVIAFKKLRILDVDAPKSPNGVGLARHTRPFRHERLVGDDETPIEFPIMELELDFGLGKLTNRNVKKFRTKGFEYFQEMTEIVENCCAIGALSRASTQGALDLEEEDDMLNKFWNPDVGGSNAGGSNAAEAIPVDLFGDEYMDPTKGKSHKRGPTTSQTDSGRSKKSRSSGFDDVCTVFTSYVQANTRHSRARENETEAVSAGGDDYSLDAC